MSGSCPVVPHLKQFSLMPPMPRFLPPLQLGQQPLQLAMLLHLLQGIVGTISKGSVGGYTGENTTPTEVMLLAITMHYAPGRMDSTEDHRRRGRHLPSVERLLPKGGSLGKYGLGREYGGCDPRPSLSWQPFRAVKREVVRRILACAGLLHAL